MFYSSPVTIISSFSIRIITSCCSSISSICIDNILIFRYKGSCIRPYYLIILTSLTYSSSPSTAPVTSPKACTPASTASNTFATALVSPLRFLLEFILSFSIFNWESPCACCPRVDCKWSLKLLKKTVVCLCHWPVIC